MFQHAIQLNPIHQYCNNSQNTKSIYISLRTGPNTTSLTTRSLRLRAKPRLMNDRLRLQTRQSCRPVTNEPPLTAIFF